MADYDPKQFEPILVPHFPVAVFTPSSACPHKGRYRRGSALCCMACHRSGRDYLPIFRNVPEPVIPKPPDPDEPDPFIRARSEIIWERFMAYNRPSETVSSVPDPKLPKETRKERRRRMFRDIVSTLATGPPPAA